MAQNFFDWTNLTFPAAEYSARRQRLYAELGPAGGTLLIPSAHHFSDGFTFRQLDDFLYFCGLELPDSVLALDADKGESRLFVPERDPRFDSPTRPNDFPGRLLAEDAALAARSGVNALSPMAAFEPYLRALAQAGRPVWVNPGRGGLNQPDNKDFFRPIPTDEVFRRQLQQSAPELLLQDADPHIARLRMRKSAAEIATIRAACDIGMAGIRAAAALIRPGVTERDLEAALESEFKRLGAQRLPFASIIKSGPNTL
ncbi:MAG: aminopeptidase P family protein, partial [Anaerolineales bacterium]|nr:aminopeptidase P family protein [Anaerolineales bacterium]